MAMKLGEKKAVGNVRVQYDLWEKIWESGVTMSAPFAHYRLDDRATNTTVLDHGWGANNGTSEVGNTNAYTGVGKVEAKFGPGGATFNGFQSMLVIPDSADWDLMADNTDSWTIDFWTRRYEPQTDEAYITQTNGAGTIFWQIKQSINGFEFRAYDGGPRILWIDSRNEPTQDHKWHHIALIKVADEYGIYKDGRQIGYTKNDYELNITGELLIGTDTNKAGKWFTGTLDELRIEQSNYFNAAPNRSRSDIIKVPTQPYSNTGTTNLMLHFDGTITDTGDTGHTPVNTHVSMGGGDFTTEVIGIDNFAVAIKDDTQGSFSFWFAPDTIPGGDSIIRIESIGTANTNFHIGVEGTKLRMDLATTGVIWSATNDTTLVAGTWYHSVLTHNGVEPIYYQDGVRQPLNYSNKVDKTAWFAAITAVAAVNTGDIAAGDTGAGLGWESWYNGKLDDVRYYKHCLSPEEVTALYNGGAGTSDQMLEITPSSPDLPAVYAHYKFNESTTNTVVSDSGSGMNNGTSNTNTINISTGVAKVGPLPNYAFDFAGTDYVTCNNLATDINTDTQGAICFWIKWNSFTNYDNLFAFQSTTTGTDKLTCIYTTDLGGQKIRIRCYYSTGAPAGYQWEIRNTNNLSTGTWYHVALVHDGVSPKLYIDGVDETVFTHSENLSQWMISTLIYGTINYRLDPTPLYITDGVMDDYRYYRHALTQAEVQAIYNSNSGTEEQMSTQAIGFPTMYSFGVTELNGDEDVVYKIAFRAYNSDSGGGAGGRIQPNNDSATFFYQDLYGLGASLAAHTTGSSGFGFFGSSIGYTELGHTDMIFYAKTGDYRLSIKDDVADVTGAGVVGKYRHAQYVWTNKTDVVTSLIFISSRLLGFGVGSHGSLYRRVKKSDSVYIGPP